MGLPVCTMYLGSEMHCCAAKPRVVMEIHCKKLGKKTEKGFSGRNIAAVISVFSATVQEFMQRYHLLVENCFMYLS